MPLKLYLYFLVLIVTYSKCKTARKSIGNSAYYNMAYFKLKDFLPIPNVQQY